jgi:hypothetical protein
MPANFSKLRLLYSQPAPAALPANSPPLQMAFNLNSINFDINHATVGPDTPYTSELSFMLKVEQPNAQFTTFQELADLLDDYIENLPDVTAANDPIGKITTFLQGSIVNPDAIVLGVFDTAELQLLYNDIADDDTIVDASTLQALAVPVSTGETNLFNFAWQIKIKFLSAVPSTDPDGVAINTTALVLYPVLSFPNQFDTQAPLVDQEGLIADATSEALFNDELRLNFELTYIGAGTQPTPIIGLASPLGRISDEITDSISNLTNTLATNLTSTFKAQLQPAGANFSEDVALWVMIKKGADELNFTNYFNYMETLFCGSNSYKNAPPELLQKAINLDRRRALPFMNVDAYRAVKVATEAFVMVNCMVDRGFTAEDVEDLRTRVRLVDGVPDEVQLNEFYTAYRENVNGGPAMIPYLQVIKRKLGDVSGTLKETSFEDAFDFYLNPSTGKASTDCYSVIAEKLTHPCYLELIWSYWHEESMLVQGLSAISRRFQNIRGAQGKDPLANLEIDPLRSLNNLMWGYIQDENNRLTVRRRAYEYDHHYGISLHGNAVKDMQFADSRSKFIEALHTLLNLASRYFKQSDDMTVRPDGFPLLNALRETHLILSEGAHNQYGDLPSVARAEMLMQQYLLARPEFREFLPTRNMIAYPEPWMDRVAAVNQLMGWTKTSVLHFNYLAQYGEKILLSIRFGNWADVTTRSDAAANWANFWRPEIQGYIHAYRAATGVDLSADGVAAGKRVDAVQPSVHLLRRLQEQQNGQGHKVGANGQVAATNGQKIR